MTQVSVEAGHARRLPRWKVLLFSVGAVFLSYGMAELVAALVLVVRFGSVPSVETISARSRDFFPPHADSQTLFTAAIHPYLGYTHTPLTTPRTTMWVESITIHFDDENGILASPGEISNRPQPTASQWGYLDAQSPLRRRAADKVIVGILGGSVAEGFSIEGAERLAEELRKLERFANKEIEFVKLAVQGFKQPQQLLTVTYLLSLGGEFDVLVNIDGFNELFISIEQNYHRGVCPSYPMLWDLRLQAAGADVDHLTMGQLAYTRQRRAKAADFFVSFPWRNSSIGRCVWLFWNDRFAQQQIDILKAAARPSQSKKSPAIGGPYEKFQSDESLYAHCVEVWRRSSLQLHQLCEQHAIVYYHFLQPNQYVPDSKPMAEDERVRAITAGSPFDRVIRAGYPLLETAGRDLESQGVRFHSLTDAFRGHAEPFYKDNCCHVNQAGSEVMAVAVASIIGAHP